MKVFYKWKSREAKWYHFWRPQSGLFGGMIFGLFIVGLIILLLKVL